MTQIFNNYTEKKLADIVRENGFRRILIRIRAGLGDAMMFRYVCLPRLECTLLGVNIFVQSHNGQECLFREFSKDVNDYDAVFELEFPCNCFKWEGADTPTKPETCMRDELGIPYDRVQEYYGQCGHLGDGVFVGLHLFSTCYSGLNCPKEFAQGLWRQLTENGLVPIDTYIPTPGGKNQYTPYDFERQNMTGVLPGIDKLRGIVKSCRGFASVSSGNFFIALDCMPPKKILFLQTIFRPVKLTRLPVHVVDAQAPYDSKTEAAVQAWIDDIKGDEE